MQQKTIAYTAPANEDFERLKSLKIIFEQQQQEFKQARQQHLALKRRLMELDDTRPYPITLSAR